MKNKEFLLRLWWKQSTIWWTTFFCKVYLSIG